MKKVVVTVILGTAAMFAPATAQVPVQGSAFSATASQNIARVGSPIIKAASAAPTATVGVYSDLRANGASAWNGDDGERSQPGGSLAWVGALGFLGLVVMRRLNSPNF